MLLITLVTSKIPGEPSHKRSLARIFAVRRHIVEPLRKLQAETHVCSQTRGLRMRIMNTNRKIITSFYQVLAQTKKNSSVISFLNASAVKPTVSLHFASVMLAGGRIVMKCAVFVQSIRTERPQQT